MGGATEVDCPEPPEPATRVSLLIRLALLSCLHKALESEPITGKQFERFALLVAEYSVSRLFFGLPLWHMPNIWPYLLKEH